MLSKGCKGAKEEIESVLEEDWEVEDGTGCNEIGGETFNLRPSEVDIKQKEECTKAED